MQLETLLYVSKSKIAPIDDEREVSRILASAHAANPAVGITGALIFTGTHFAQVLEGEKTSIDKTMATIAADPRHEQVNVVSREALAERRFPGWSMAYRGPSQFVSRHVTRLMHETSPSEKRRAADWLTELLEEFSR